MIMPTIRASLSRRDARQLVALIARDDPKIWEAARLRLDEHGVDSLLDDPRVLNGLLTDPEVSVPPPIVFYVLVRQALLKGGIDDPGTADYVASLIAAFGRARRAYRISAQDDGEFHYLADIVSEMRTAGGRRQFLLRMHMGDFALWMSGLFPDYLEARSRRRGAPPIAYFEELGADGYRLASQEPGGGGAWDERPAQGRRRPFQRGTCGAQPDLRSPLLAPGRRSGKPPVTRGLGPLRRLRPRHRGSDVGGGPMMARRHSGQKRHPRRSWEPHRQSRLTVRPQ